MRPHQRTQTALTTSNHHETGLIMNASTAALLHTIADGVAVVTLNRPEAMNSMNNQMRMEMHALFPRLDLDDSVRVIVLTGAGDKAFCSGADLKERAARTTQAMVHDRL